MSDYACVHGIIEDPTSDLVDAIGIECVDVADSASEDDNMGVENVYDDGHCTAKAAQQALDRLRRIRVMTLLVTREDFRQCTRLTA